MLSEKASPALQQVSVRGSAAWFSRLLLVGKPFLIYDFLLPNWDTEIITAAFGLPGYTLKGLEKQFEKRYTRDLKAKLIAIRLRQGIAEFERVTVEEKEETVSRWKELGVALT